MPMPSDIGAIDLMIGFPAEDARRHYDYMKANFKDEASAEMEFPAEYMFKDVPNHKEPEDDAIAITLGEMDKYGVGHGHDRLRRRTSTSGRWPSTRTASSPASRSTPTTSPRRCGGSARPTRSTASRR